MLQSVKRAYRLDKNNADVHACVVRLSNALDRWLRTDKLSEPVTEVIQNEMAPILQNRTALEINQQFLEANSGDLPAIFQGNMFILLAGLFLFGKVIKHNNY